MEIWKSINGYKGFYEVSNYGRVRSLDRIVYFKNNKGSRLYKGKILKQKYHNGYAMVNLNKNKKLEVKYVHRLVAEHFLPNPNNLPCVNHIDGVKCNNYIKNLEWCTYSRNNLHALSNNLRKNNIEGLLLNNKKNSIKIACYKDNTLIHISNNSRDLAQWLITNELTLKTKNIETISRIIRRYSKENKKYYNLSFMRIEIPQEISNDNSQIITLLNNRIIGVFNTSKECAIWLLENHYIHNANINTISRQIRKLINTNRSYHNLKFQKLF